MRDFQILTNQGFIRPILVQINYLQSLMKFCDHLIVIHPSKLDLEVSFSRYIQSIRWGLAQKFFFTNLNQWVSQGNLWIKSKLSVRKIPKIHFKWTKSSWRPILAGIFLIYINDLSSRLKTNVKLFADDTSLLTVLLAMISDLSGKYFLIQIHINLLKTFYFQEKRKYQFILS